MEGHFPKNEPSGFKTFGSRAKTNFRYRAWQSTNHKIWYLGLGLPTFLSKLKNWKYRKLVKIQEEVLLISFKS